MTAFAAGRGGDLSAVQIIGVIGGIATVVQAIYAYLQYRQVKRELGGAVSEPVRVRNLRFVPFFVVGALSFLGLGAIAIAGDDYLGVILIAFAVLQVEGMRRVIRGERKHPPLSKGGRALRVLALIVLFPLMFGLLFGSARLLREGDNELGIVLAVAGTAALLAYVLILGRQP